MSIGAGRLKGRRLVTPAGARPSSSRLKAALFSIWGERVPGAEFLDLFAGSGAVGIEAWSRGAERVTLVEGGRRALEVLRDNATLVSAVSACRVVSTPVARALPLLASDGARFDLLFADPPYDTVLDASFFRGARAVAGRDASLAVEHRVGREPEEHPPGWRRIAVRRYGDSALSFYEPDDEGSALRSSPDCSKKNASSSR